VKTSGNHRRRRPRRQKQGKSRRKNPDKSGGAPLPAPSLVKQRICSHQWAIMVIPIYRVEFQEQGFLLA